MAHGVRNGTMVFVTLQLALVTGAHAKIDPLRCDARTLRCDSTFYDCLARCDRQMDTQSDRSVEVGQARHTRCESSCDERHSKKIADIKAKPPCKEIEITPNPRRCEARYLRLEANCMDCESRCDGRTDPDKCKSTCETRYGTDVDELMSEPVCKNGRVTPTPASTLTPPPTPTPVSF